MKATLLILFALIMIPTTASFAEKSECNINDEQSVRAVLSEDMVIQKFLERHPSAEFVHNPMHDEPGNPWATSEFSQNGISLVIIISAYDESGGCYGIQGYSVSYDMPPTGVGVILSRTQTFESDQKNEAVQAIISTTNPPEQIKNGVPITEIKCREGLVPTFKRDRVTPACVTETTWNELILRGWSPLRLGMPAETNILITYDAQSVYPMRLVQDFNSEFLMANMIYWVNNDVISHSIIAEDDSWNVGPIESGGIGTTTFNQTGVYPYHIKENPNAEGRLIFEHAEHEPYEPQQLDIANIEDRHIRLNPADTCATISLELMSPDELGQTRSGTKDVVFLELDKKDIEGMPILDELIRATHYLEFPANDYSHAEMGLRELVD
ncbi:MAG: hypothetical protein KC444_05600, partial [Nitrosopumilus sp.]|nr:hypothetical protein [Nitrosopumilus sp.]